MPVKKASKEPVEDQEGLERGPLRTVQAGLKKLDPQMLKLTVGHNQALLEFLEKKGTKTGLPPIFIVANLLGILSHMLAPGQSPCHTAGLTC